MHMCYFSYKLRMYVFYMFENAMHIYIFYNVKYMFSDKSENMCTYVLFFEYVVLLNRTKLSANR